QRRRYTRRDPHSAQKIRELQHRVESTGRPGVLYGLTGGCRDCGATAELLLLPGHLVVGHIYHDDGCPALAGITTWEPEPIN
ncbi:MAG TPA: hypothetical protein VN255_01155, partial [Mycobacterium sp.]|nr:hypothetical protein [Mycobacterium sp.]